MDVIENLIRTSRNVPIILEDLSKLEKLLSEAIAWKEKTSRTFLRKNSTYTLFEVNFNYSSN